MANWGYTKVDGPDTWENIAPAAKGHKQSPIDIQPAKAQYDASLKDKPFQVSYTAGNAKTITNNGKSITMAYDVSGSSLTGGPLSNKFQLAQFHFHWGSDSSRGSEHRVNGHMYASELHLVHANLEQYPTVPEAMQGDNGLCVLGVFLKPGKAHKGFQRVIDLAKRIPYNGDTTEVVGGYDPSILLPEDQSKYWTYSGSLTTPPCWESVNWVVFKDPIEVSEDQLNELRALHSHKKEEPAPRNEFGGKIVENYRPPLAQGSRTLRASFQ